MRFGHGTVNWYGRLYWYHYILIGLAALIVYPDKIVDWIGERTGWALGWLHLMVIEVTAITLTIVVMIVLMPVYPTLEWWYPVLCVAMLAAVRASIWIVAQLFGFND